MRLKLYRMTAFAVTSLACLFISFRVQVSAQEVEAESTTIETAVNGDAIPGDAITEAITVDNPSIEVEDLELLIKSLTLEELQNEVAAWLILLKKKVQEISAAEIVIKHKNRELEAQKESIKLLEDSGSKLVAAKKAQVDAKPNAAEKLIIAKESLNIARSSVQDLAETEVELKENKLLQESLKQGRRERGMKFAKETLKEANRIRKSISTSSPQYKNITEKIDALKVSINNVERAEAESEATIPDSAEYKQAEETTTQAFASMKNARSELIKILIIESSKLKDFANSPINLSTENLAQKADRIEAELAQSIEDFENIEEKLNVENIDRSAIQEAETKLTKVSKALEEKLEKEDELKKQLVVNVTDLEDERAAIVNRVTAILDDLDKKGGDSTSSRQYVETVSSVDLDLTDTEGLGVRLLSWVTSPDGGLNLLLDIAKFGGILLISVIIAPQAGKISNNILSRVGGMSTLFRDFTVMLIKRGIVVLGFLLGLAALGVNLGPVLALIGGASFILAFALQSNLANFASGLMLLINKPFDVGDEVNVSGYWAFVDSISIASTKLKDFSGNIITLPNNTVWGSDIINYTHADIRKFSLTINVKFTQDLNQVREMWMEITAAHPKILEDPAPSWFPWNGHYDYYVGISLTAWSKTNDYWPVYVDLLKELQARIMDLDIQLAAPQQEIKLNRLLPEAVDNNELLLGKEPSSNQD